MPPSTLSPTSTPPRSASVDHFAHVDNEAAPTTPQQIVARNKRNRTQLLTQIYHELKADVGLELVPASIYDLGSELGLTPEETEAVIFYYCEKGYFVSAPAEDGSPLRLTPTGLTVKGIDHIEFLLSPAAMRATEDSRS